jgi:hypothetical protein
MHDLESLLRQHLDDGARDGIVELRDVEAFIAGKSTDDDQELHELLRRAEVLS